MTVRKLRLFHWNLLQPAEVKRKNQNGKFRSTIPWKCQQNRMEVIMLKVSEFLTWVHGLSDTDIVLQVYYKLFTYFTFINQLFFVFIFQKMDL